MEEIKWKMKMSVAGEKQHSLLYTGKYKGLNVTAEIHTPKNAASGKFGKQKQYFFIQGDKTEFRFQKEMQDYIDAKH